MENTVNAQVSKGKKEMPNTINNPKGELKVTKKVSIKAKDKAKPAPKVKELTPNQKKMADLKAGKKFKIGYGAEYRLEKDEKGEFYVVDARIGTFETLVKKFEGKLFRTSRHLMGRNISVSVMLDEVTIIEENDLVELEKGPKA